jgi:hypothetical protein
MDLDEVRRGFVGAGLPPHVVEEVLAAYVEAKRSTPSGITDRKRSRAVDSQRLSFAYSSM